MNKKIVNCPSSIWVFVDSNKISRGRFKLLDTDSKSAVCQNKLAQRERQWTCDCFSHSHDNEPENALKNSNKIFMKNESREKINILNYFFCMVLNMYI